MTEHKPIATYDAEKEHLRITFRNGARLDVCGENAASEKPIIERKIRQGVHHGKIYSYMLHKRFKEHAPGEFFQMGEGVWEWQAPSPKHDSEDSPPHSRYLEAEIEQDKAASAEETTPISIYQ